MKIFLSSILKFILQIILFSLVYTSVSAQLISTFPNVDSLNFVGSCTPPVIICELKDASLDYDTIVISSRYGDPLCTGLPPSETNTISSFNFMINKSNNQYRYELWIKPSLYYDPFKLGFDTAYGLEPQLYWLILYLFSGDNLIDTVSIRLNVIQTGLSVDDYSNAIPKNIILHQNYPNPFNPTTTIKFDIPNVGTHHDVSLKIYDILGKEVATLVNEQKEAGSYEVQSNASKLASGIYFYRLTAGSYTSVKKLMLLK